MADSSHRMPLIDALKGVACVAIVWHHLAFYGPMSDAAQPLAPALIGWLYEYARMAVQVFLVVSGYLTATSLAPRHRPNVASPGKLILRRYWRLATPCMAALGLAVMCSAIARLLMTHDSISAPPGLAQLLAHLLLLQHLLGFEALSAGIWYVAIDFQLYVLTVLLLLVATALDARTAGERAAPVLASVLTTASLFAFNLDARLEDTGLYFFGAYGLGMLARWAGQSRRPALWWIALAGLGAAALLFAWRDRVLVALVTALLLAWPLRTERTAFRRLPGWLAWLGSRSFAIFLVHFPVSLVVSGLFTQLGQMQPGTGALGMACAFAASLLSAEIFHRVVESPRPAPAVDLRFHAGFLGIGLVAMLLGV